MADVNCVMMRGGTSKGLFFLSTWLDGYEGNLDKLLINLMGSPDPTQIDGLGGGTSTTSKAMIVDPVLDDEGRVRYLFAQVAVEKAVVDYGGNCGNLTAAVAAFVVDEGIVTPTPPYTRVRLFNQNTKKTIEVEVPSDRAGARSDGEFIVDGVPGSGAEIVCKFLSPSGSVFGQSLPTGCPIDRISVEGIGSLDVSVVDVSNPLVFVRATDLGLKGTELPSELNSDAEFLARVESIRGTVAAQLGLSSTPEAADTESPGIPKLAFVARPQDYVSSSGVTISADSCSVVARIMSVQKVHPAYALTGAMCTAAAAVIPGTVVNEVANTNTSSDGSVEKRLVVGHPKGLIDVIVAPVRGQSDIPEFCHTGVSRTARRLFKGRVYAKK